MWFYCVDSELNRQKVAFWGFREVQPALGRQVSGRETLGDRICLNWAQRECWKVSFAEQHLLLASAPGVEHSTAFGEALVERLWVLPPAIL